MRRCNLILTTMAILLSAASPAPARDKLTEEQLYAAHVEILASEKMGGRSPGTPGAQMARKYLIAQLRDLGFKPAFNGSYCQPFPITLGIKAEAQQLKALGADKKPIDLKPGRDFNALALSSSKAFSGPAVFVGYAISDRGRKYDNFAKLDKGALKGKVAIAMRYEPQDDGGKSLWADGSRQWTRSASLAAKSAQAARYGASALLIVNPPAHSKAPLLTTRAMAYGRRSLPVMHLSTDALKRMLAGAGLDADAEIARLMKSTLPGNKALRDIPALNLSGKVSLKPLRGKTYNIGVTLPGRGTLADQAIIIGAHWDHVGRITGAKPGPGSWFPGADDNASGTAGVLMLARRLAAAVKKGSSQHRRAIVLTCFGAEERGLLGSAYMSRHLNELGLKDSQVTAMINMDMIGRLRSDKVTVWGVELGKGWEKLVRSSFEDSDLKLKLYGAGLGMSDHASFYRRKIPVACFTTGLHPDIHRPGDSFDKIDPAGAIRVLNVVDRLVRTLATRADPMGSQAEAKAKAATPEK